MLNNEIKASSLAAAFVLAVQGSYQVKEAACTSIGGKAQQLKPDVFLPYIYFSSFQGGGMPTAAEA